MDNQKIVVILLLITIVLSVFSVVVTLGITTGTSADGKVKVSNLADATSSTNAKVNLVVEPQGGSG